MVAAGLAACAVGLAGADAGVIWILAGVWTVRAVWGSPPGYAWGLFCLGVSARWGTLSVADVETAARIFGPGAASGSLVVRAGMATALIAAVVSEARIDGLRARSWALRAAAFGAQLAVVALALGAGAGNDVSRSLAVWGASGAVLVAATLMSSRAARSLPPWVPAALAAGGVALALIAS